MTRPRLSIRVRLTLLHTGLFAACGAVVVAITYALVASLPEVWNSSALKDDKLAAFIEVCQQVSEKADEGLRAKCDRAFQEGVMLGAQGQREATLDHLLRYSLVTLAAVTLLAALAGWIAAGRALRPVHRITAAARSASAQNLSARVALTGPRDELRELAETFDDLLSRLQSAFEGQRRFIANASHELRTPLTLMRATVDVVLAKPEPSSAELLMMGRDVRTAVDHAEGLVDALLTLARNENGLTVREQVDLATVIEDVLDSADLGDRTLQSVLHPAPAYGDPLLLERLGANLVDNAVRYNRPGGRVGISTGTTNGRATLEVVNTGPVVPPGATDGLFLPFQRLGTRTTTDGFGLGLAIVASIAAAHGATVKAVPNPQGGLRITIAMPLGPSAEPATATATAAGAGRRLAVADGREAPDRARSARHVPKRLSSWLRSS
jgi:signal transduction histidine kinase